MNAILAMLLFVLGPFEDRANIARRVAAPEYAAAIAHAVEIVDPDGLRPGLESELYRICMREARCGQYGSPGIHRADRWTGRRAYRRAVERGRLRPGECPGHSIEGRGYGDFGTRGGWGVNAARALRWLDGCHGPEALDDPGTAALVAARMIVACTVDGRPCACSDRAALWVGRGVLLARPLFSVHRKSRVSTVAKQCGPGAAAAYAGSEALLAPRRLVWWLGRIFE